MKLFDFEVIESDAVPPGVVMICDKEEWERLMERAKNNVIEQLRTTGLLTSFGMIRSQELADVLVEGFTR